jgi:three-Cys-motif partner protein
MTEFKPHEIIPDAYKGREQAYIKHLLLDGYLERLLYIMGWNAGYLQNREVIFVDCFAGPWQDDSADLASTSIAISLRLLAKIRDVLQKAGRQVNFRAIYVERDPVAYNRLQNYLSEHSPINVATEAIFGDFVDKIPVILQRCPADSFAFFFIDPKGWSQIYPSVLNDLLRRPKSEFLINFMYEFINRAVSMPGSREQILKLFDDKIDFSQLPEDADVREQFILQNYRMAVVSRAHERKYRALSGYVTIMNPVSDRTKYHLIYITRHPLGIIEFMTQSEKMAAIQSSVRIAAKINKRNRSSGMDDLFGVDTTQIGNEGRSDIKFIEEYWLEKIGTHELVVSEAVFADAICQTNRFPAELQQALKNLIERGEIENVSCDINRRKKNFVEYKNNEILRKVPLSK